MTHTHCQTLEHILRNTQLIKGLLKGASCIQVALQFPMLYYRQA